MADQQATRRSVFGDGCERCGAAIYTGRFCSAACARPEPSVAAIEAVAERVPMSDPIHGKSAKAHDEACQPIPNGRQVTQRTAGASQRLAEITAKISRLEATHEYRTRSLQQEIAAIEAVVRGTSGG